MTADSGNKGLIIWPIAQKLFQSVMNQQRPRWTGGRRITVGDQRSAGTRPVLPWNIMDRPPVIAFSRINTAPIASETLPDNFALCAVDIQPIISTKLTKLIKLTGLRKPSVVHALKPLPAIYFFITGISRDSGGSVLANCRVSLFRVDYDSGLNKVYTFMGTTISSKIGYYIFAVNTTSQYMIVAYNSSETVAGATLNNLTGIN
jgi:hypothetical protein